MASSGRNEDRSKYDSISWHKKAYDMSERRNSEYSERQMDLLPPSCWDAPEAAAHSSYCATFWTCP